MQFFYQTNNGSVFYEVQTGEKITSGPSIVPGLTGAKSGTPLATVSWNDGAAVCEFKIYMYIDYRSTVLLILGNMHRSDYTISTATMKSRNMHTITALAGIVAPCQERVSVLSTPVGSQR